MLIIKCVHEFIIHVFYVFEHSENSCGIQEEIDILSMVCHEVISDIKSVKAMQDFGTYT